jgi:ketosteroid isomerase-like protein
MSHVRDLQASVWDAECRHDIDELLSYFHPDATFHASGSTRKQGHDAIRALTEDFYRAFPKCEIEVLGDWSNGDSSAVIEFRAHLRDSHGKPFVVNGVNVVEVADGKFTSVRSYEEAPAPVTG